MSILEEYTNRSMWLTKLITAVEAYLPGDTVASSLLLFAAAPYVLATTIIYLAGSPDGYFPLVLLLGATSAALGPALIWHFDQNVFPTFLEEVAEIVTQAKKDELRKTVEYYEQFFHDRYWLVMVPWGVLLVGAVVINKGFFRSIGIPTYTHPAFLVTLVFSVWWAVVTGIVLHGGVTGILCVRDVADLELVIDPLHPDGLGGLSTIGYFSIRTTLMNSVTSLTLPLGFAIASEGGYQNVVYFAVFVYIGFLLVSFVYPTFYVNRRAQAVRETTLEKRREQIRTLEENMDMHGSATSATADLNAQLQLQSLRDDFREHKEVNLYPLSVSILTRLATSILLPITFTLLEAYVFSG
jgi:hypothetical protein